MQMVKLRRGGSKILVPFMVYCLIFPSYVDRPTKIVMDFDLPPA